MNNLTKVWSLVPKRVSCVSHKFQCNVKLCRRYNSLANSPALQKQQSIPKPTYYHMPLSSVENLIRRAVLYVPGDDERKIEKAFGALDADCIALDCEDGVALNRKSTAREKIASILKAGKPHKSKPYDLAVRINALETNHFIDDIDVIFQSPQLPDTVLLPKVHSAEDVKEFAKVFNDAVESKMKLNLLMYIESARGMMNLKEICQTALTISAAKAKFNPVGLIFGGDDYFADIGAIKTDDLSEIQYARQKFVMIAKAFKMQAIDVVYTKYKDLAGCKLQAEEGVKLGFTGKQVIHPDQVALVQNTFLPSSEQLEWAQNLVRAFEEHQQLGQGAFVFNGHMIDMPTMKQAANIIELHNHSR